MTNRLPGGMDDSYLSDGMRDTSLLRFAPTRYGNRLRVPIDGHLSTGGHRHLGVEVRKAPGMLRTSSLATCDHCSSHLLLNRTKSFFIKFLSWNTLSGRQDMGVERDFTFLVAPGFSPARADPHARSAQREIKDAIH